MPRYRDASLRILMTRAFRLMGLLAIYVYFDFRAGKIVILTSLHCASCFTAATSRPYHGHVASFSTVHYHEFNKVKFYRSK